jgi:hypothetical protein
MGSHIPAPEKWSRRHLDQFDEILQILQSAITPPMLEIGHECRPETGANTVESPPNRTVRSGLRA